MYEKFLMFMFGVLWGSAFYELMKMYGITALFIPLWSGIVICLFIFDKIKESKLLRRKK